MSPSIVWAIVGLLLIFSEFFVPEFVIFFFGAGALLTAVLAAVVPGLAQNIPLQILVWALASGGTIFALRKYLKTFRGKLFKRSDDVESIGKIATVVERITADTKGRIRYQGTTWTAYSLDKNLEPGDHVEIMRREGMDFYVSQAFLSAPATEIEHHLNSEPASKDE